MESYIIMCRTITYAQRAQRLLDRAGIRANIVKAPQGLTSEGCSYGIRVSKAKGHRATEIMRGAGIKLGKSFYQTPDGEIREIEI
ncbi:MAG: DUF3343 domain-containing protein [Oscillospiraceae bacterium]|nr:DUF3343 domain-containing protein [Oscillospiraceae bacterium]